MRALGIVEPGEKLEELDLPDHEPAGTEVAVAVERCGVCHSDVHFWEGYMDFGGRKASLEDMGMPLPLVPGHEIAGRVRAAGPDAEGIAAGEACIVYPWIGCGDCFQCDEGRDDLCDRQAALGVRRSGGFGAEVVVPHPKYLIPLGDLDPAQAATLACSGLTAYAAVAKVLPAQPEDAIVIIGAGGVGLSAVAALVAAGHGNIVVVDIEDERLLVAEKAGARATVNSAAAGNAVAAIKEAAGAPIRGVIDFVNSEQTAPIAFPLPVKGGKIVQVGLFGGAFAVPLAAMAVRGIALQGSYVGSLAELKALVDLAKSGKFAMPGVETVAREEATNVLAGLRDGKIVGRRVLDMA